MSLMSNGPCSYNDTRGDHIMSSYPCPPNAEPMIPKQYTLSKPDDLCTTYYYPEEASPAYMDLLMRPPPSTTMTVPHRLGLWCVGLMALRPSCMDSWWNSFLTGLYHADTSM